MKKLIFCFFSLISFTYVQSQCNSNPISDNGASGTVNFSDSSFVTGGWSTNYSVSYLFLVLKMTVIRGLTLFKICSKKMNIANYQLDCLKSRFVLVILGALLKDPLTSWAM